MNTVGRRFYYTEGISQGKRSIKLDHARVLLLSCNFFPNPTSSFDLFFKSRVLQAGVFRSTKSPSAIQIGLRLTACNFFPSWWDTYKSFELVAKACLDPIWSLRPPYFTRRKKHKICFLNGVSQSYDGFLRGIWFPEILWKSILHSILFPDTSIIPGHHLQMATCPWRLLRGKDAIPANS